MLTGMRAVQKLIYFCDFVLMLVIIVQSYIVNDNMSVGGLEIVSSLIYVVLIIGCVIYGRNIYYQSKMLDFDIDYLLKHEISLQRSGQHHAPIDAKQWIKDIFYNAKTKQLIQNELFWINGGSLFEICKQCRYPTVPAEILDIMVNFSYKKLEAKTLVAFVRQNSLKSYFHSVPGAYGNPFL